MKEWDYKQFEEKLGHKVQFGFMVGKSLSGKSTVAKFMEAKLGFTIIDMKAETEKLRESKAQKMSHSQETFLFLKLKSGYWA